MAPRLKGALPRSIETLLFYRPVRQPPNCVEAHDSFPGFGVGSLLQYFTYCRVNIYGIESLRGIFIPRG